MIQARRNRRVNQNGRKLISTGLREILFIFFCFAGLYLFISLATYNPLDPGWLHSGGDAREVANKGGLAGAMFADAFLYLFGYFAYLFAIMVVYVGWLIYQGKHHDLLAEPRHMVVPGIGFLLTLSAGCGLAIVHFTAESALLPSHAGGILGTLVGKSLESVFSQLGATLLLLALFFTGITLLTGLSWLKLMDFLGHHTLRLLPVLQRFLAKQVWPRIKHYSWLIWRWLKHLGTRIWRAMREAGAWLRLKYEEHWGYRDDEEADRENADYHGETDRAIDESRKTGATRMEKTKPPLLEEKVAEAIEVEKTAPIPPSPARESETSSEPVPIEPQESGAETIAHQGREALLPSPDYLTQSQSPDQGEPHNESEMLAKRVNNNLQRLKLGLELKHVFTGPVVTRVELQPNADQAQVEVRSAGEKLARALGGKGIRVVEATPAMLSLEVPRRHPRSIMLGDLLTSSPYLQATSPLTLALGCDSSGQEVVVDLARMPHLLLAGNQAEDIDRALHAIMLSLLYKATNREVRFILVDANRAALSQYADLPHLLTPVINKVEAMSQSFRWCVAEMERRYRLMADLGVRNIEGYNRKVKEIAEPEENETIPLELSPIPYIVIVVHEIAEVTLGANHDIEEYITRLAQKARAAGIHMLLATQRPTVNVVTGLMKTNFPSRIAFRVTSQNESRTVLGQHGAESLLNNGDMLYLTPGTGLPVRVHGPLVSEAEVKNVLAELKKQETPDYADLNAEP